MHQETITRPSTVPIRSGIVMTGYGIKVAVDRRHLAVSDGIGRGFWGSVATTPAWVTSEAANLVVK